MPQKSLIIVGGGYAGVELAKGLENHLDVTLVEPRDGFIHAPAMLRSLVDPAIRTQAIIPYDKLLTKGLWVKSMATTVTAEAVTTADGEKIAADYIVLATGASNGGIFKPAGASIESFLAAQTRAEQQIKDAKTIVVVGAGAVGTELAGEIAHHYPEKSLSLVSADLSLFPGFPAKLGKGLEKTLRKMGVNLILGQRVENLQSSTAPYSGIVNLTNGGSMEADLVISAIGSKPQTALFETLPDVAKSADGRVKVDSYMRPSSLPNVFAAGDAVDTGDAMTIVAISRQHPWLAKTLKALAQGKDLRSQKHYSPWSNAPCLVPLGPQRGHSFLGFATFGDWVTRTMKGRELFIPKYRKLLGY